ncbi:signal peptidase I [Burkholderia sp. LMG 32019]|uniref:signal peptidase I n=1 Tax=Burkholderia sp. LMG 32019 TaxID=3158173 RepID=UPI003C300676
MTPTTEAKADLARPGERGKFAAFFFAMLILVYFFWTEPPISLGFDPQNQRCLPNLHLALMIHRQPSAVRDGDLLFWRPQGALAGFKERYILKMVAGVPGDRVTIRDGKVAINGRVVADGFPLARYYKRSAKAFERDEVIPSGQYFLIGVHPESNDSRYWGYLEANRVAGYAYRLF